MSFMTSILNYFISHTVNLLLPIYYYFDFIFYFVDYIFILANIVDINLVFYLSICFLFFFCYLYDYLYFFNRKSDKIYSLSPISRFFKFFFEKIGQLFYKNFKF